jgi:hypothetical protein
VADAQTRLPTQAVAAAITWTSYVAAASEVRGIQARGSAAPADQWAGGTARGADTLMSTRDEREGRPPEPEFGEHAPVGDLEAHPRYAEQPDTPPTNPRAR